MRVEVNIDRVAVIQPAVVDAVSIGGKDVRNSQAVYKADVNILFAVARLIDVGTGYGNTCSCP